jgi:hypothetical protein
VHKACEGLVGVAATECVGEDDRWWWDAAVAEKTNAGSLDWSFRGYMAGGRRERARKR